MANNVTLSKYPIWEGYTDQKFEDACKENRLKELVEELASEIGRQPGISESKLENGCRAICMIPSNQTELISVISAALEIQGLWKFAQEGYFNASRRYYKILKNAQKVAISQKNLPAALELVSKIKQVDPSLKQCVLESLPEKSLITSVVEKDQMNILPEKRVINYEYYPENGYMFVDPNKANFSQNSKVLQLLKDYEQSKHPLLSRALSQLITSCDEVSDVKEIVRALNTLENQLEECVEAARHVLYNGWSGADKAALVKAIKDLPPGRRVSICKATYQLSLCSWPLEIFWKLMEKQSPDRRKGSVVTASKKDTDSYSYQRFIAIINALKKLDDSGFAERVAAAKAYLDARQLSDPSPIQSNEICKVIEAIKEGSFRASEISHELMQFSESQRAWVVKIFRKRLHISKFFKYVSSFKKISEEEMKAIYAFFKVKKDPIHGWNQKFDNNATVWDEVLGITPGEIEDVLRGTQLLMRALHINTGHGRYIFAQLHIKKITRKSLTEKLFLLFSIHALGEEVALRLTLLVSKLPPEQLTREIYDVLMAFEKDCNKDTVNELLKLPTEIFSQLSFHYYYEPLDKLGQEGLKSEIQKAGDHYNFAGLRTSSGFPPQLIQPPKICSIQ